MNNLAFSDLGSRCDSMLSWSFLRICKSIDGATTSSTLAGGGEEEAVLTSSGAGERAMQQLQSLHSHMHIRLSWDLSDISRQSMHKFIHSFGTVGTCVT